MRSSTGRPPAGTRERTRRRTRPRCDGRAERRLEWCAGLPSRRLERTCAYAHNNRAWSWAAPRNEVPIRGRLAAPPSHMLVSGRARARLHLPMGRLPRLRLSSGGLVRTGSLVALVVVLFPAATLAMSGLNGDHQQGEARDAARSPAPPLPNADKGPEGIFKLDHLIFIVQENRSFDHYFGTYAGADGLEMVGGVPTNCVPDPVLGRDSCAYHT